METITITIIVDPIARAMQHTLLSRIYSCLLQVFLLPTFLICCSTEMLAQQKSSTDQAVARLADQYNSGQYLAIYNQFSPQSKAVLSPEAITHFYQANILPPLGLIRSWNYIDERKTDANYQVNFDRGKMGLRIALNKELQVTFLEWYPMKPEKEIPNPKNTALIQTNNPKQSKLQLYVDSLALAYLRDPNNSSLSIGIVNGNTTEQYYYGEMQKDTQRLPNEKSVYEIGSITKTFTAALLAHALNEKKLNLQDDIRNYLPGNFPQLEFNTQPLTLLSLANHTSGLPLVPDDLLSSSGYDPLNPFAQYTKEMIWKYLERFKPVAAPGQQAMYSNLGYALLGFALEKVYQQPMEVLVKKYISTPLQMNGTYFELPDAAKDLLAKPYAEDTGKELPYWQMGVFNAAGGLKSNLQDMLRYLQANMTELNPDFSLAHKETNRQADFSRGLTWLIEPFRGQTKIFHGGGTGGFRSWCGFIKNKKLGVVILSNSSADAEDIANHLLSFLTKNTLKNNTITK